MKVCPRCNKKTLNNIKVRNSLSRIDNKTYICNNCGDEEAKTDKINR